MYIQDSSLERKVNMYLVYENYNLLVVGGMFFFGIVFNATFNNISGLSRRSVLLVEETTDLP